jgi:CDP-glucose 4,6-dehydratase
MLYAAVWFIHPVLVLLIGARDGDSAPGPPRSGRGGAHSGGFVMAHPNLPSPRLRGDGPSAHRPAFLVGGRKTASTVGNFNWSRKKVLVTGASGFKGAYLCWLLAHLGAEVYGVVNNRTNPESAYQLLGLNGKIVEVRVDVSNRRQVLDLINAIRPDVIFHLAAKALVPCCLRDPARAYEVNVMGTIYLIDACRVLGLGVRLVICSTDHVFGPVPESAIPLAEDSPLGIGGPYCTSKAAMEMAVRSMHGTFTDNPWLLCITRAANCFGPADTCQRRVIPHFINSGLERGEVPLTVRLNGRQFVHVCDCVTGYILAASRLGEIPRAEVAGRPEVPTFHFALEHYSTVPFLRIKDLAITIAAMTDARVVESPDCVDYAQNAENPVQGLSCQRTRQQLGWQPSQQFEPALAQLVDFHRATTRSRRISIIRDAVAAAAERLVRDPTELPEPARE